MNIRLDRRTACLLALGPVAAFAAWMVSGLRAVWVAKLGDGSIVAGSAPNIVAVVLISLIYASVKANDANSTPVRLALMGTATMAFYEVAQLWIPERTFDVFDLLASFVGGFIALAILLIVFRTTSNCPGSASGIKV